MLRTILIVTATLLAAGSAVLGRQIPVQPTMKQAIQILVGVNIFFILFFVAVQAIDDDYVWWTFAVLGFTVAAFCALRRWGDINRLIFFPKSRPEITATERNSMHTNEGLTADDVDFDWATLEEPVEYDNADLFAEPRPRRFLDDFHVADEAELRPSDLELDRLDDFVFTARHGYLVHQVGQDEPPCDVITILPGMSIADLIEVAKIHVCNERPATVQP